MPMYIIRQIGDDGDVEEWIGPYNSGQKITVSHTWDEEGAYIIRAKYIFDAESDWGTLEVTMPVSQQSTYLIFELFRERFPILYQIMFKVLESNIPRIWYQSSPLKRFI